MKISIVRLFSKLAHDVGLDPFTLSYCISRLKNEGIRFLTVTLPMLSKAVIRSLELGYFDRPTSIAWKGRSLRYFRSFLNRIFDYRTGKVLESVDCLALWQVRQLCEYSYKLALPFEERELKEANQSFVTEDEQLSAMSYETKFVDQLRKDFETHYRGYCDTSVASLLASDKPRPGPGTFSGKSAYERTHRTPWYCRKELDYSCSSSFKEYKGFLRPLKSMPSPSLAVGDPLHSEVLFVPKDSRGPRTIVREPFSLLQFQMAFNSFSSRALTRISRGRINFSDQSVNRRLAEQSSKTKENATLDLKSASDRVSYTIMLHIFRNSPLKKFILSSTRFTRLPGSTELIRLNKLSGMGSGLTFPLMSLLIHLSVTRLIVTYSGLSYSEVRNLVYVYGDDLIVPTKYTDIAVKALELVKLKVNVDKSFHRSFFRESCGGDYYQGQDVAPVRLKLSGTSLRYSPHSHDLHVNGGLRYVEVERHCRELVRNGLVGLAEYLYQSLEKDLGRLPSVSGDSPVLGRYSILPVSYGVDETGAYVKVRAIVPVVTTVEFAGDVYLSLSRSLRKVPLMTGQVVVSPTDGSAYGEVPVPRTIKYRRTKVSAFRLMG